MIRSLIVAAAVLAVVFIPQARDAVGWAVLAFGQFLADVVAQPILDATLN